MSVPLSVCLLVVVGVDAPAAGPTVPKLGQLTLLLTACKTDIALLRCYYDIKIT